MKPIHGVSLLLTVSLAVLCGLGLFTFFYAKGYSYLTHRPEACVNCHVMKPFYESWQVSSHRQATCNDCHVPHSLLTKYWVKAENGFRHSFAFTFEDTQIFRLKSSGQKIVEKNCIRCHEALISSISHAAGSQKCLTCHQGVAHGAG